MSALVSLATGLAGIALLLGVWITVQLAWRRAFPAEAGDPDALSGRLGCRADCIPGACGRACPEAPGRRGD